MGARAGRTVRSSHHRNRSRADGDIRPWSGENPTPAKKKCRRRAMRATASLATDKELHPSRTEIILRTGLRTRGSIQTPGRLCCLGDSASGCSATASTGTDGALPRRPARQPSPSCQPGGSRPDSSLASEDTARMRWVITIRSSFPCSPLRLRSGAIRLAGVVNGPRMPETKPERARELAMPLMQRTTQRKASRRRARRAAARSLGAPTVVLAFAVALAGCGTGTAVRPVDGTLGPETEEQRREEYARHEEFRNQHGLARINAHYAYAPRCDLARA